MSDKVLITGGTGFLGSYLASKLVELGYKVSIFDNNLRGSIKKIKNILHEVEFIEGDIRNVQQVQEVTQDVDVVFHLAFINGTKFFYEKPDLVLDVGVKGAINILDCSLTSQIKTFIMASSSEVYNNPSQVPTSESERAIIPDIKNPRFSYAGGKLISELLTFNYLRKTKIRDMIFRPHNIFGPDMGNEHVIPELIRKIFIASNKLKSNNCSIEIQGTGKETRAFCFVDDAVEQLVCMLKEGKKGELYNIGMQREIEINKLINDISDLLKIKIEIRNSSLLKGSTSRRCPDTSKIKSIGYKESDNYYKGLKKTIAWYIKYLHNQNK